jgi:hypothetical protein
MSKIYPYGILMTIDEMIVINQAVDVGEMLECGIDPDECAEVASSQKHILNAKLSLFKAKFEVFMCQIDSNLPKNDDTEVFKGWMKEEFGGKK